MARKGRKTRWRKLPIPVATGQGDGSCGGGSSPHPCQVDQVHNSHHPSSPSPKEHVSRVTFNEDEYTKITTPRQDMLFKKGYLSKKRSQPQEQVPYASPEPTLSPSGCSVDTEEQYVGCDEASYATAPHPQFLYPTAAGYVDPTTGGLIYINGGGYEVYDAYSNSVTVVVGPGGPAYGGMPLVALPCHAALPCHTPLPFQTADWFNHAQPHGYKKRNSTDSQNWGSSQSCESPSSCVDVEGGDPSLYYSQQGQYVYPGYVYPPAPLYSVNGVSVEGVGPRPHQAPPPSQQGPPPGHVAAPPCLTAAPTSHQASPPADQPKRRKKRRKRRRPGTGDDGSESSCEEVAGSGVSSDAGQGSSCSKTTDSGVHTGADSPQPQCSSPAEQPADLTTEEESQGGPCPGEESSTEDDQQDTVHSVDVSQLIERRLEEEASNNEELKAAENYNEVEVPDDNELVPDEVSVLAISDQVPPVTVEIPPVHQQDGKEWSSAPEEESDEKQSCSVEELMHPLEIIKEEQVQTPLNQPCILPVEETETLTPVTSSLQVMAIAEEVELNLVCSKVQEEENEDDNELLKDIECVKSWEGSEIKEDSEEAIAEETGYSEEGWGSAEETSVEERWALALEVGEEATVDKPITEAVTRWLEMQGSRVLTGPPAPESEDEGIGEEHPRTTVGSKNAQGNPCPVHCPSTVTRVADLMCPNTVAEVMTRDWRAMCDPLVSVDRYYHLVGDSPPSKPRPLLHLDPSLPLPCGLICCILQ